jgi:hypothetical protein
VRLYLNFHFTPFSGDEKSKADGVVKVWLDTNGSLALFITGQ